MTENPENQFKLSLVEAICLSRGCKTEQDRELFEIAGEKIRAEVERLRINYQMFSLQKKLKETEARQTQEQQSPVNWFIDNLPERFRNAILNTCVEEIKQAREMERQLISRIEGDSRHTETQMDKL